MKIQAIKNYYPQRKLNKNESLSFKNSSSVSNQTSQNYQLGFERKRTLGEKLRDLVSFREESEAINLHLTRQAVKFVDEILKKAEFEYYIFNSIGERNQKNPDYVPDYDNFNRYEPRNLNGAKQLLRRELDSNYKPRSLTVCTYGATPKDLVVKRDGMDYIYELRFEKGVLQHASYTNKTTDSTKSISLDYDGCYFYTLDKVFSVKFDKDLRPQSYRSKF